MRIERACRWPTVPRWAIGIVIAYFSLVGLYVWVADATGANPASMCLFRRITGYPCPTCGSTHMILAAARGHLREAAGYNPLMFSLLVLAMVLLVVRIVLRRRIVWITSARSRRLFAATFLMAVLANWLYVLAEY